jgi:hypothetical protein
MKYSVLDTVVLNRDLPEHGLKRGDLGAIVEIYDEEGLEVEFVTASGRTGALLTLSTADVRQVADADLVAVRSFARSA